MSLVKDLIASSAGGPPAFFNRHSTIGDTIAGTIVEADVRQMTDYESGKPRTWDNGDPVQQIAITLTDTGLSATEEDNGDRRVFVKWFGHDRSALLEALKAVDADDLLPGGRFTATYVGEGEQKDRKLNPPKLYRFEYQPPSATAGLIAQAQQPVPITAAHSASPAPAAAPAPAADPQAALAQIKALIGAGLTDEQIAAAVPGFTVDAVAAVRAIPAA